MSEDQSGVKKVRREIAIVAGPKDWGDTRESWLARVPRKVKTVSFRTVKALWYGEISDPEHWAARDIRREAELIEAKSEAANLASKYQEIAGGMRALQDQNLLSAEIDRLERIARILGGLDRA
ncbi:hypothetical protein [Bradyrhizobium elkanii]|uniref:hypothetical protein n=1 Tax=Bradyrhizobium elkanii TaxID=29448 RepID=UPI001449FB1E|nr:hypothetical protein [Bradyrhizobium elkanii]MCP1932535.1 hypothetical protein [Bradyrhizobium elkanii]MCS3576923.1 hypothetical protein [Bradyrhizobium elkanii]MCS3692028.1 hypothetical protein [Bradyrhizobium elkanii]MCS3719800.1 hypothetical protein [Bradyrhizobium elkanii]MCS4004217.1 hypothetical protein [Bradyrhizobium elkanii USDA 61]